MKRIFLFTLTLFLSVSFSVSAFSENIFSFDNSSEKVTFIVEVEGDPVLSAVKTRNTYSEKKAENIVLENQAKVLSIIQDEISSDAEKGFVYTSLFNGFSLECDINQLDELKSLPGVKNVYISETIPVPETNMITAGELTDLSYSHDNAGYTGEGQVVAVIDVYCDTSHDFFSSAPENPKYTKSDIDTILKNSNLNSKVTSANQVYKSTKIPYAFNYVTGSSDTYSQKSSHGTHVSGISVGKNGILPNGEQISGVAPESQLMFFSAGTEKGLSTNTILAAINDAALLKADVINMSFSINYRDSSIDEVYENVISNAKKAGISIICSAGNESKGYDSKDVLTKNIDYSTSGEPANVPDATAVASVNNKNIDSAGEISHYSSWGVDSSLELKPEISAPGGNICSSVPDNKYAYMSGTSMSAPHMTGITALARQYYESDPFISSYNNITGAEKINLIENLAMNSAEIVRNKNGVPFSPRVQGAGLVNIKNIINSKVILKGNSGKSKVSLGEISTNSFNVEFSITNISSSDITFDDTNIELLTDGYKEKDGNYYVDGTVKLDYKSVTMPDSITIKSGETYNFIATVSLDDTILNQNKKIFSSGFFIDGFIILKNKAENINASLPFTGFYGDWDNITIFDKTAYDEGGSLLTDPEYPYDTGTYLKALKEDDSYLYIGRNNFDNSISDKKYISFSLKNNFKLAYFFNYYRSVCYHKISILDKNNKTVYNVSSNKLINKFNNSGFILSSLSIEEGEYTFRVSVSPLVNSSVKQELNLPFVIDNTSPEIINATYKKEEKKVTIKAKDNHYISGFILTYYDDKGNKKTKSIAVTDNDYTNDILTKTITLDCDTDENNIYIKCVDYAINETITPFNLVSGDIGAILNSIEQAENSTSSEIIFRNNTEKNITADLIIAFYNSDGTLISTSIKEDTFLSSKENKKIDYEINTDTQAATSLKIFMWEPNSQNPLSTTKTIYL